MDILIGKQKHNYLSTAKHSSISLFFFFHVVFYLFSFYICLKKALKIIIIQSKSFEMVRVLKSFFHETYSHVDTVVLTIYRTYNVLGIFSAQKRLHTLIFLIVSFTLF